MDLGVGLPFETLVQIFVVFEGFSLWRGIVAQDFVDTNQTDIKKICRSFFRANDDPENIVKKYNRLTKAWSSYRFYSKLSPVILEKPYITLICMIVLMCSSLFFNFEDCVVRCLLTWLLLLYMVLKIIAYWRIRYVTKTFVELLKAIVPVDVPDPPDPPDSPTWTAL